MKAGTLSPSKIGPDEMHPNGFEITVDWHPFLTGPYRYKVATVKELHAACEAHDIGGHMYTVRPGRAR